MKKLSRTLANALLAGLAAFIARPAQADTKPEVLHYKFSGTGTSVPNLATAPPPGTATATIMGGVTQTGADQNVGGGGFSLMGSGNSSTTDYLNTGWSPDLGTGSWTISIVTANITPSATLFYIFGDINTNSFRCFTNGVAGANNWWLRGAGLNDVPANGGATVAPHRTTFVYDINLNNVKAYIDGVLVNTVPQAAPNITGPGPFKVMGYASNVGAPAGGLIDDFRVYSRALSAAEVADIDAQAIISVTGNAVVVANGDNTPDPADHTDFGDNALSGGTVVRTFTVANNGNLDLTLSDVTVSGANAGDFTVNLQPTSPVAGSTSTTFQVTFDPSALGLRTATLTLSDNDEGEDPFVFSIQGTANVVTGGHTTAPLARALAVNSVTMDALSDVRTEVWYRTRLFANRSYQFSAWPLDHEQGVDAAQLSLGVFSDDAGTVAATVFEGGSGGLEGTPNAGGDSKPFTATLRPAADGVYKVRVSRTSGGTSLVPINLMLRETTLFAPWTSRGAGFEGFVEMHNNTGAPVEVTLRAFDNAGVAQGAGITVTLQPNATDFKTATQIGVPVNVFAGIALIHNGASGAVSANITTLNGANGLSFDSPFTPRDPNLQAKPVR